MWHASRLSQVDASIIDDRFHLRSDKTTSFRLSGPVYCLATTRYRHENDILSRTNRAIYCFSEIAAQFKYKLRDKKIDSVLYKFDSVILNIRYIFYK